MSQFYTKGTIKIKNADGVLESFYPKTKEDMVVDMNSGTSLSTIIENIEDGIETAANSGGVKVLYEDDNSAIETFIGSQSNESMVAVMEPDVWSYTVDTKKYDNTETNAKTSIPFDLYNVNNASITVYWGDNTTSTFTKADYSSSSTLNNTSSTGLIHTYSEPGIYTIVIKSGHFSNIKLYVKDETYSTTNSPIYYYQNTLVSVNEPLPKLANTNFNGCFSYCSSLTSIPTGLFDNNTDIDYIEYCFYNCNSLTTIPTDLFRYNTSVNSFYGCFYGCSSLTTIPTDLFKYNTLVISFARCFEYCESLTSIPTDLFRYNTLVTSEYYSGFYSCFSYCSSLTSIPEDLFRYNTANTNFSNCFYGCSSITSIPQDLFKYNTAVTNFSDCFAFCSSITSIPQDLFKYNTAVTNFNACFYRCSSLNDFTIHIGSLSVNYVSSFCTYKSGTTRTVYVPTGSTTQTKFNSVASSLGLTIIGE